MLVSCFIAIAVSLSSSTEANIRGWVEHARIMPDRLLMSAKLDSGAQTTSIHAEILTMEELDGIETDQSVVGMLADTEDDAMAMLSIAMMDGPAPDDPPAEEVYPVEDGADMEQRPEMITFRLTSRGGKEAIYTEPVVRWVSIRRRGGGSITRPVVMMELCVAGLRVRGEVNLADRTGFNYPLLIGRNMLGDAGISVDSRKVFASSRACPRTPDEE